jgi:hypothetical protein
MFHVVALVTPGIFYISRSLEQSCTVKPLQCMLSGNRGKLCINRRHSSMSRHLVGYIIYLSPTIFRYSEVDSSFQMSCEAFSPIYFDILRIAAITMRLSWITISLSMFHYPCILLWVFRHVFAWYDFDCCVLPYGPTSLCIILLCIISLSPEAFFSPTIVGYKK